MNLLEKGTDLLETKRMHGWLYRQKGDDVASWKAFLTEAGLKFENSQGFLYWDKDLSIEKSEQIDRITLLAFRHNVELTGMINLLPL